MPKTPLYINLFTLHICLLSIANAQSMTSKDINQILDFIESKKDAITIEDKIDSQAQMVKLFEKELNQFYTIHHQANKSISGIAHNTPFCKNQAQAKTLFEDAIHRFIQRKANLHNIRKDLSKDHQMRIALKAYLHVKKSNASNQFWHISLFFLSMPFLYAYYLMGIKKNKKYKSRKKTGKKIRKKKRSPALIISL
ncbi:MAG: hypothetical protein AAF380_01990 [Bacteroidota bacterium]